VKISSADKRILRELGRAKAEVASEAVNAERRELWTRLNDLDAVRPMVWVFEIPWNEMDTDGELTLRCRDPFCRRWEQALRQDLYQWKHMPADMVMDGVIRVPPVLRDANPPLAERVDVARTDPTSAVLSRHFQIQIRDEGDIEKIPMPELTLDREAWDRNFDALSGIFDGVIAVERTGIQGTSVAPWDQLVRLTGVDEILTDLRERPQYVHALIDRMMAADLRRLEQWEALNLLAPNNARWLGGGYQFTRALPGPDWSPARTRPADMWGRTMSQIFSAVSPAMHEEFALRYECRWLRRFGLAYYGCCEPLHLKMDILRRNVPNLRKVSMSPWVDLEAAARNVGRDYVFSWKPNPAFLAEDAWRPDAVRADMDRAMRVLKGLHVEIILKDISMVRYQPRRLWEWVEIATDVARRSATG